MKSNRRVFVIQSIVGAGVLASTRLAQAQTAGPMLAESDPQAVALGYKADGSKVDKAKFPKYEVSQNCANCALYQGKPTDASAPCPLFAGKQVAAKGWCSSWVKKA